MKELIKNLEEIEPITFIAIGKHMGFYINHKIYKYKNKKVLGINHETPEMEILSEDWYKYFVFKKPVYKKHFGLSFLNMDLSMGVGYGETEYSNLVLEKNCNLPISETYQGICAQLEKEGFDVRDFVQKIKRYVEPNLKERFNLKHKFENISSVANIEYF